MLLTIALSTLLACDGGAKPGDSDGGLDTALTDDFCGVQHIFADACVSCHSAAGAAGGLDLETDPHAAIVGVDSAAWAGEILVRPGDSARSLLYLKMLDEQGDLGGQMPVSDLLPAAQTDVVAAWIDAGASSDCGSPDTGAAGYHPAGWDGADQHGLAAKLQEDDCQSCHGDALDGGDVGISCDSCHAEGWRSDCTYCHGGTETAGGAPPEDIDDRTTDLSFGAHTAHVASVLSADYGCVECHVEPGVSENVLADGHVFDGDTTPGVAEVVFVGGLSSLGSYVGAGSCSNLYCHGDGAARLGAVEADALMDCASCHSSAAEPDGFSESHIAHIDEGASCEECHAATVLGSDTIADRAHHVDGAVDTSFLSDMVYSGGTCTGSCHDVEHAASSWSKGSFHPAGFDEADQHGLAAKLQVEDCTSCHGLELAGGSSGGSCDSCHMEGWRTDCTYCHGGADNSTGAPPHDIDGSLTALSFDEHTVHVEERDHPAWDCEECHLTPEDVLSDGHIFIGDSSPGQAELSFVDGLAAGGVYEGVGSCSNLYCHGNGAGTLGSATTGTTTDCASCHGSAADPGALSTVHAEHLDEGASCQDCHATTASGSDAIATPAQHVDGDLDTSFPSGLVFAGGSCTGTCHGVSHAGSTWEDGGFHPDGWDEADQHGLSAKLLEQDCTTCHGSDLEGGSSGESCDSCHTAGWRTDCTYCHGGTDNSTGAPPDDIDGSVSSLSFDEHTGHVEEGNHAAWDCEQCHSTPTDVLSDGHIFIGDSSPAEAELSFVDGLSPAGRYAGAGSCSNLYCHGNGNGTLGSASSGTTTTCSSCHGSASSTSGMSGHHWRHLDDDIRATCDECHGTTVSSSTAIADPELHVNGTPDTFFESGMVYTGTACTGSCHGKRHTRETW